VKIFQNLKAIQRNRIEITDSEKFFKTLKVIQSKKISTKLTEGEKIFKT